MHHRGRLPLQGRDRGLSLQAFFEHKRQPLRAAFFFQAETRPEPERIKDKGEGVRYGFRFLVFFFRVVKEPLIANGVVFDDSVVLLA